MSDLTAYFDDKAAQMVDLLTVLIEYESPSRVKQAVDTLGAYLANEFKATGATVTTLEREEVGDILLAKWNTDSDKKPVLILAHMDTVWPIGTLAERPVRIDEDGRLYGPGAVDMKGGIVVALHAISGLQALNQMPERPIWFMVTSDEEIGSTFSRGVIEQYAAEAALVLVVEPPNSDGSLKTWRKGVATYHMTIEGKASHAGNEPEQGINSIIEFAQQALEINQLNDLKNGTSVSVTTVEGGSADNVIPAKTVAHIDVRTMSVQSKEALHAKLVERLPFMPGATVTIEMHHERPPMERDPHAFDKAKVIAAAAGMTIREDGAGGGSDGNFTAAMGIPTLDGLGAEGAGLHAEHEHVLIRSLPKKAALIAALLRDWD